MTERQPPLPESIPLLAESLPAVPGIGAAQRLVESVLLAAATSTGLYLVGSVYIDSYYGRMSIDATSLDLSSPFVALQAMHVLPSLLEYPITLGILIGLYRLVARRLTRVHDAYDWMRSRLGRVFLFLINLLLVSPLLLATIRTMMDPLTMMSASVVSEVNELMQVFGGLLLVYVIWLSFGARRDILGEPAPPLAANRVTGNALSARLAHTLSSRRGPGCRTADERKLLLQPGHHVR